MAAQTLQSSMLLDQLQDGEGWGREGRGGTGGMCCWEGGAPYGF